jgi:hypothetical protein
MEEYGTRLYLPNGMEDSAVVAIEEARDGCRRVASPAEHIAEQLPGFGGFRVTPAAKQAVPLDPKVLRGQRDNAFSTVLLN